MDPTLKSSSNRGTKYDWSQSYDGVVVYVDLPPDGIRKADICVEFAHNTLSIRLGKDTRINGELCKTVDIDECTWLIDDGKIEVHLTKAIKGEVWDYVLKGDRTLTVLDKEAERKRILLERFQNEHPGFDFSDADINGTVPEPRTFMRDN